MTLARVAPGASFGLFCVAYAGAAGMFGLEAKADIVFLRLLGMGLGTAPSAKPKPFKLLTGGQP
jgi:hypothetical protein